MARTFSKLLNYFPWYQRLSKSPQLSAWACLLYLTPPPSHSLLLIPMSNFPPQDIFISSETVISMIWSAHQRIHPLHTAVFSSLKLINTQSQRDWEPLTPSDTKISRVSTTQLSAHYKPGMVLKIPLNCKPEMVLKIPQEQGCSHKTHSIRITFATFVIKLVCPLLTLLESWHHVLLKIYLIWGIWTSKTVLLKITITNNFYNHESYKNKK